MFFLVIFLLFPISSQDSSSEEFEILLEERRKIPDRNWFCGAGWKSRWFAYGWMKACFAGQYGFNHQCAIHDDCYDQQMGQEKCDDQFCEGNALIAKNDGRGFCKPYVDGSCLAVKQYGAPAYASAATHQNNYVPYLMHRNEFGAIYNEIFTGCKLQNATFSSCGYNYEECLIYKYEKCGENLKTCILDTKNYRTSEPSCDLVVEKVAEQIKF
ncbi:unnamed protein product [Caenorhabditis angaria]|uniref:Uncharacterized protein n=1 Tax=Caenorhabditis angaria TaxID=860376 RepID=A0A9P1IIP7_9PELO|nr:unnamed protein product [Caenorhabditis angaria]